MRKYFFCCKVRFYRVGTETCNRKTGPWQNPLLPSTKTALCSTDTKQTSFWRGKVFSISVRVARWFVFKPKIPIWVNFWRVLCKILVHLMIFWTILWPLAIFYGHLVYFVVIWYIFPRFGILYQENSGNPDSSDFSSKERETELCMHMYVCN
jgi:hypothetical protein